MVEVPSPSISAPIARRQRARSAISGSRAAFSSTVVPRASVAAMSAFSVAPTETSGKGEAAAAEPARGRAGMDVALAQVERGAHRLQRAQVEVHGTRADGAAARQRDHRLALAREERAEHEDRGAHAADDLVVGLARGDGVRGQRQHAAVAQRARLRAERAQQRRHGGDVAEARRVGKRQRLLGEQRRGHQGEAGVLGARDLDAAREGAAAMDHDLVHQRGLLGGIPRRPLAGLGLAPGHVGLERRLEPRRPGRSAPPVAPRAGHPPRGGPSPGRAPPSWSCRLPHPLRVSGSPIPRPARGAATLRQAGASATPARHGRLARRPRAR